METPKYSFVENANVNFSGFKIIEGKYKDVIYYYGKVKFIEDNGSMPALR